MSALTQPLERKKPRNVADCYKLFFVILVKSRILDFLQGNRVVKSLMFMSSHTTYRVKVF